MLKKILLVCSVALVGAFAIYQTAEAQLTPGFGRFRNLTVTNAATLQTLTVNSGCTGCGVSEGSYTPTAVAVTNVDSATCGLTHYYRVLNRVFMSTNCNIDATAGTGDTRISMTLPIASNFTGNTNANSTCSSSSTAATGAVFADATNDVIIHRFQSVSTSSVNISCSILYIVQ